ncbi:MAG: molybdopterin dinucleotide binding domain-containing protein [Candidatus Bathyarchaeia archaeon]
MEAILLTGRTIDQGCSKESGKEFREYKERVAICEMNVEDMKTFGIKEKSNVKVTTEFGSIIVKAIKSHRLKIRGMVFIPYGLWVNQVLPSNTDGTGMPLIKGVKAIIEPTNDEVPNIHEILSKKNQ